MRPELAMSDVDTIRFRQEVFADLERPEVYGLATGFAKQELVAAPHGPAARAARG